LLEVVELFLKADNLPLDLHDFGFGINKLGIFFNL
jgi:hypothetical protein